MDFEKYGLKKNSFLLLEDNKNSTIILNVFFHFNLKKNSFSLQYIREKDFSYSKNKPTQISILRNITDLFQVEYEKGYKLMVNFCKLLIL